MNLLRRLFLLKGGAVTFNQGGFNPFGSWDEFSAIINRAGFAWKNLVGQDKVEAWTPGISFGGGTTGITYQLQVGRFYVVGKMTIAYYEVSLSSKGSSVGNARLTGLPFKSSSFYELQAAWPLAIWEGMTGTTMMQMALALVEDDNTAFIYGVRTGGGNSGALSDTDFSDSAHLVGGFIYMKS